MSDQSGIYRIDQQKAMVLCQAAADALAGGESAGVREMLLRALYHRPSSALAFRLLGDSYRVAGDDAAARLCDRNELPRELCRPAEPQSPVAAGYRRIPVFDSEPWAAEAPGGITEQCAFDAVSLSSNECFVDHLSHGMLWHDDLNTLVCDQYGAVVSQHTVGCAALMQTLKAEHQPFRVSGRAVLLGAKGAHNFYHWTTDIIPKLPVFEGAGFQLRETDTVIVSRAALPFARQLLARCGVQPAQVIETESCSPFLQAEELIVPYVNNKMGYGMGRWLPDTMRRIMTSGNAQPTDRRIFINRRLDTAAGRTLSNSESVEEFFTHRGYEVVYPEALSVLEQAHLFSSASVVAGVHGAGLANIVYCARGTKVIEFYGAHIAPCYWLISALSGFDYYQHPCQTITQTGVSRHAAGLTLPLDDVELLLDIAEHNEPSQGGPARGV